MTEVQLEAAQDKTDADFRRQIKRINIMLLIVLVVLIVGPTLITWWAARQYPAISTISITDLAVSGKTELCPGEPLVWTYDFHAAGAGTLVRDKTLWSVEPPRTKIFSTREYFILEGQIDQHLTESWHIPATYINPETDMREPLPPGEYKRLLSISSPSRSTVVAIASVYFTVKEGC
jgi:hypothetical protein